MHGQPKAGDIRRLVMSIVDWVLRFRYLMALAVFILLVAFKIDGSNINCWSNFVKTPKTTLAGEVRGIRSDEWEVLLPVYISQQNSDTPFSVVNPDMTLSGQNVVITLDAPVKDIYTLSKPLHWGFFFLNADHALAWYWDLKTLLILLLSFELCMILTRQSKLISVLGSLWITLSPAVQWWFVQHVGDNVLYILAIVVTFYYFCKYFGRLPQKILFAFLFCLSCIGFVMPLYPPVQIPFGLLALILMALIFTDFRKQIRIRKTDILILGAAAVFTIAMLAHLYLLIKDVIPLMTNTVYPGKRVSTGGGARNFSFYSYLTNIFLPYKEVNITGKNSCELSSFYNFLPAALFALPILIRRKVSVKYGIALAAFSVFFALYMTFPLLPAGIAKITLLSYVTGSRAVLAYAFAAMLLSIWALAELSRSGAVGRVYAIAVTVAVAATCLLTVIATGMAGSIPFGLYLAFILVLALLSYLLLRGRKRAFAALMACVVIASGATVNPVNIGAGGVLDNPLSREIREVDRADSGAVWLAVDNPKEITGAMGVLIYLNGAKSLGGINNYPDYAKWSAIDPQGRYQDIYNRSAHISFRIVRSQTSFVLLKSGVFMVNLNVGDLKKLNVKYIVSSQPVSSFGSNSVRFTPLYAPDKKGCTIYRVSYAG